jgi:hypothetical protein
MTHDYKRHGTTTLFAALDVLEGRVIGRCMQRHRHQEFIRFLNALEAEVPAGKVVHVILDNYATLSWTTTAPINIRRSGHGSHGMNASSSTLPQPHAHGSTLWRASSQSSPNND